MDKICTTLFLLVSVTFVDQIQARYDLAFILTVLLYRCYELYTIDDENKIDWLDSTILKESLTAALTLFLFFSTNFSIAFWICSWVSLSQVTWLFPFDWFVLVRAPFTEFYTDVYIWVPQSESEDHGDIMIRRLALVETNWYKNACLKDKKRSSTFDIEQRKMVEIRRPWIIRIGHLH